MGINLMRLKMYRIAKKLTQKELASSIDMPYPTYSTKESGKSDFTSKEVSKIAKVLEIEPNDLFEEQLF